METIVNINKLTALGRGYGSSLQILIEHGMFVVEESVGYPDLLFSPSDPDKLLPTFYFLFFHGLLHELRGGGVFQTVVPEVVVKKLVQTTL